MLNKKDVLEEIERLSGVKILVQAYEEIAASRMRKIRQSVLQTRDFLTGLTEIYKDVQSSYKNEIVILMKKKNKGKKKLSLIERNGKTVAVLTSANSGLYGDIIKKTFFLFLDYVKKNETDIVVIGKLGKTYLEEQNFKKKYTYFDLPDSGVNQKDLTKITSEIINYERILVFYGQFQTVVTQNATMTSISDNDLQAGIKETKKVKYIFEPSLEKIMAFFEKEIFASIFEQSMHESQLAKFASRMVSLDKATGSINDNLKKVELEKRITTHRAANRKQMEALSGMALWG